MIQKHRGKVTGAAVAVVGLAVGIVGPFEGLRTKAYPDIVGVITVCYGETRGVKIGDSYTKEQCDEMLGDALVDFEAGVRNCVPGEIPDKRRASYVSLAYNIGVGGFCRSTVARKANEGDARGSCDAMLAWNKAGGRVVAGLTRRREAERKICLSAL
ncbi:lysozyme [Terrarubrum flagellatum]|uniref:lysozyme n=1 Tax=Terrirubrum flagellatum TaxID=2895980 RepID=UPI0031454777